MGGNAVAGAEVPGPADCSKGTIKSRCTKGRRSPNRLGVALSPTRPPKKNSPSRCVLSGIFSEIYRARHASQPRIARFLHDYNVFPVCNQIFTTLLVTQGVGLLHVQDRQFPLRPECSPSPRTYPQRSSTALRRRRWHRHHRRQCHRRKDLRARPRLRL